MQAKSDPPAMELRRMGPLNARVIGKGQGPIVVLLHGFGAPGDDLVPLSRAISAPAGTRFVFPEAPHELSLGGMMGGRAWWLIDIARYQRAIEQGAVRDLSREVPVGLAEARQKLSACLDAIRTDLGSEPLFLGGFSQGAMLATDLVLRTKRPVAGLGLFSGTLLAAAEWTPLMPARAGLACVQSHGTLDPILPYALAEDLRDLLTKAGWKLRFVPFPGPHTIPAAAIDAFAGLIASPKPASKP